LIDVSLPDPQNFAGRQSHFVT
jgi:hypothetical protein